jgi:hypothetical protein
MQSLLSEPAGPSSPAVDVTKRFLQEYLDHRGIGQFVDWHHVEADKSLYFPLLLMVPADPLLAKQTASRYWHGASASRLACILSAGRLVRGCRQVEGKYGVCLAGDVCKALEYAPAFDGFHFVFHVDAFKSYPVEQLAGDQVLCREHWVELKGLVLFPSSYASEVTQQAGCFGHYTCEVELPMMGPITQILPFFNNWDPPGCDLYRARGTYVRCDNCAHAVTWGHRFCCNKCRKCSGEHGEYCDQVIFVALDAPNDDDTSATDSMTCEHAWYGQCLTWMAFITESVCRRVKKQKVCNLFVKAVGFVSQLVTVASIVLVE